MLSSWRSVNCKGGGKVIRKDVQCTHVSGARPCEVVI
jgi:hypothetical protein